MEATQTNRSQTPNITKLYDAALQGDTNSLLNLLQEDPLILDRCIIEKSSAYTQSPLHVAANAGHIEFTRAILDRKPELAEEVDQVKIWSPLHVASAKGHLPIIQTLVDAKPQMCFAFDRDGRTPIHIAAVNGRIAALDWFLKTVPLAVWERTTNKSETVMHLCVKNNHPDALRLLVEITHEHDLLNSQDSSGNTVLHLAVAAKQTQIVEFLETCSRIEKNAMNNRRQEDEYSQARGRGMEAATTRLYEATLKGEISPFLNLLREDPLVLNRCMIENSGRFVQSPLHVAADMGHLDIVRKLIELHPSMCLTHDQERRNPIHVAAIKGQSDVLRELHRANPHAAQEKTYNGETALHLCVKHNQLKALETLLGLTNDDGDQLINFKDKNGNTVLHLAVTSKQTEMVEYLVAACPAILKNAMNKNKMTPVDIYLKQNDKGFQDGKIKQYLKRVNAKPAKDALSGEAEETSLEDQRSTLMVVASLIATMAFQAGINPPGGVWQDTVKGDHAAGDSIWSYYGGDKTYRRLLISNTIGLISSLSVIILLISGLPLKRHFLTILRVILWISVTATSYTYLLAINYVTQSDIDNNYEAILKAVRTSLYVWIGLMTVVFLGNATRFIKKVIGWQRRQVIKKYCKNHCCTTRDDNHGVRCLDVGGP